MDGKIEIDPMITHKLTLEQINKGFDLMHEGKSIRAVVEHYNHRRYHESLQNLTPADVYFGRGQAILKQRERIKRATIETRRLLHRKSAA